MTQEQVTSVAESELIRGIYQWRKNVRDKWAWFDGERQVTGACMEHSRADYVFEAHALKDVASESTPVEVSFATHPEFERFKQAYGNMTLDEIDSKIEQMDAEIAGHARVARREFNGNGGRRTGAAVSAEAVRVVGNEKLLLSCFRQYKAAI